MDLSRFPARTFCMFNAALCNVLTGIFLSLFFSLFYQSCPVIQSVYYMTIDYGPYDDTTNSINLYCVSSSFHAMIESTLDHKRTWHLAVSEINILTRSDSLQRRLVISLKRYPVMFRVLESLISTANSRPSCVLVAATHRLILGWDWSMTIWQRCGNAIQQSK